MAIGGAFVELGRYLEECERGESTVADVRLAGCERDGAVRADVDVRLSPSSSPDASGGFSLQDPRVGPDGTLQVVLEPTNDVLPTGEDGIDVAPSDPSLRTDGTLALTLSVTVATDDAQIDTDAVDATEETGAATPQSPSEAQHVDEVGTDHTDADSRTERASRDDSVPPFKNPELLREIYESCDTFAAMADELDMDVTAETVRRYMIDFDIHQPKSYSTSEERPADDETDPRSETPERSDDAGDHGSSDVSPVDGDGSHHGSTDDRTAGAQPGPRADTDDEKPVVLSDGIGLPEEVTIERLIETVERSNTIYEVKRDIGLGREDALAMLQELNLLDLVTGRLATEAERDISREEIVDRLREASATQ